ncbi:radical SAM protein [Desulfonatronum sp. SC1]|uniref:radical SAM protein n=1 Tax=Desulfonatronum sp. SC1 TaxID=2109626 RepID=UPI000D2F8989|nr:radical SAM protein [Desulfonatronum sp. SC1]PTN36893.1 radical SAM protein [Desulfonatronum sp. SC1]
MTKTPEAGYLRLHAAGVLRARAAEAVEALCSCTACPRQCRVNRLEGELGFCRVGRWAKVASYSPHFGEEEPLVGNDGSGTIFFAQCNLACVFCQNHDISHHGENAPEATPEQLAVVMLELQGQGVHNINFVTPSHVVPQILEALVIAADQGLRLPLVYNSSGYDGLETLLRLDGVVDIYMPDAKFFAPDAAKTYCHAEDYPERAKAALKEMHRQVGDLELDDRGVAVRGLLVRHLVMPGDLAGTAKWMDYLAAEISPDTYVNIMDQYRPCGEAGAFPELGRPLTAGEFEQALKAAAQAGITRLDQRPRDLAERLWRALL